ncbi:glutathione S-transferase [Phanerochaete sordida]|uniref:glutathione transferase n=1 Tax=Phanerochaete sordida TaxID=48140 RepID=A0A9P3LM73_9APHY|nr:glutathione S-transferase [Phanerochaete sordida]
MSHGKQFTLYTNKKGPNGWKVAIVLEELGLAYEPVYLDFGKGEQKAPAHTKHNPNGRIPTLIDHANGDYTLWESDAILYYLVEKYDPEHKVSVADAGERFQVLQWLFFQASGQGPYFGQALWFKFYHSETLPSAQERYQKETKRVLGVLEGVLAKQDTLVGGKITIADLSFIPWNDMAINSILDIDVAAEYPVVTAWHKKLVERPAAKKVLEVRAAMNAPA